MHDLLGAMSLFKTLNPKPLNPTWGSTARTSSAGVSGLQRFVDWSLGFLFGAYLWLKVQGLGLLWIFRVPVSGSGRGE